MSLRCQELKAFVPAKDFALSKRFYADLGFAQQSEGVGGAYFHHGDCAFLLQDHWVKDFAENLAGRYGATVTPVQAQPWGITEFLVIDPAGVCWHIGQNTPGFTPVGRFSDGESPATT